MPKRKHFDFSPFFRGARAILLASRDNWHIPTTWHGLWNADTKLYSNDDYYRLERKFGQRKRNFDTEFVKIIVSRPDYGQIKNT